MDHDVVRAPVDPWTCPVAGCGTVIAPRLPSTKRAQVQHHVAEEIAAGHSAELEAAGAILVQHRVDA